MSGGVPVVSSFPVLGCSFQKQQEDSFAPRIFKPHKPLQAPFDVPQSPALFKSSSQWAFRPDIMKHISKRKGELSSHWPGRLTRGDKRPIASL
jgi:hypothetical protein